MGCTDVYRMVVQCGIHVAPIWDHMYNIYTICTQHGSKCVLYRMNRTHGLIVLMAEELPDMHSISTTAVTLLFSKRAIKLLRSFVTVDQLHDQQQDALQEAQKITA